MSNNKNNMVRSISLSLWAAMVALPAIAHGQEAPGADVAISPDAVGAAAFVPSTMSAGAGSLELRDQATIYGPEVKLKQLCRWSDNQAAAFTPVADLVVTRIDSGSGYKSVSIDDLRNTLHDAGVNVAVISFTGATACTVKRSDPIEGDRTALQAWIDRNRPPTAAVVTGGGVDHLTGAQLASAVAMPHDVDPECNPFKTLRDRLAIDLSQRLNLPVDKLQVQYDGKDTSLLNLSEPNFRFEIEPKRVSNLGNVSWQVTIQTDGGEQKVNVAAVARAWETQLTAARPVAYRSVLRAGDVVERRILLDRVPDEQPLTRAQAIGQEAARDLTPGTVMTGRLVNAVALAKAGQYVTVTLNQGGVQVKTVAKAMEGGSYGQSIKVRNEETRDIFDVTLTGPQVAQMGPIAPEGTPDAGLASIRD